MNANQFKLLILIVCFASPLFSDNQPSGLQTPLAATTFAKRIRATGSLVDTIQTADNSYVSVSRINPKSFLVQKIASSGGRVWGRILTLQVEDVADLAAITQTTDGGYILAGYSTDCVNGGIIDCFVDYGRLEYAGILIRLRPNGTVKWKREYRTNFNVAGFSSLVSTADGGVIVTGFAQNHLMLARYTSNGTLLWSKDFPDLPIDYVFVAGSVPHAIDPHLVQTPDNSLIVVANVARLVKNSLEPAGAFVIKVNDSGTILWKKSLKKRKLFVQKIAATSDNGIVLAGSCYNNCKQLFMVRLKADGSVQSKRRYSPQVASVGPVTDIIQTSDDGFTIAGCYEKVF